MSNAEKDSPPVLGVEIAHHGGNVELTVTGEIDMATAAQLQSTLMATIDAHPARSLTIDLAGVSLLAAAGMTTLVQVFRYARRQHIEISVVNARPLVARMIAVGGLTRFLGLGSV